MTVLQQPRLRPLGIGRTQEVVKAVEVFFQDDAEALGVERGTGKVAVISLVIDLQSEVSAGHQQVAHVEVANE